MKLSKLTIIVALAIFAALGLACDSAASNDPNSPTNITKRFVKAAQTRNVAEYKSVMSRKSLAAMDKDAKEVGMKTDALVAKALEEDIFGKADGKEIETHSEEISGDKATVQFKDGSGKWLENDLTKEDGAWKVSVE